MRVKDFICTLATCKCCTVCHRSPRDVKTGISPLPPLSQASFVVMGPASQTGEPCEEASSESNTGDGGSLSMMDQYISGVMSMAEQELEEDRGLSHNGIDETGMLNKLGLTAKSENERVEASAHYGTADFRIDAGKVPVVVVKEDAISLRSLAEETKEVETEDLPMELRKGKERRSKDRRKSTTSDKHHQSTTDKGLKPDPDRPRIHSGTKDPSTPRKESIKQRDSKKSRKYKDSENSRKHEDSANPRKSIDSKRRESTDSKGRKSTDSKRRNSIDSKRRNSIDSNRRNSIDPKRRESTDSNRRRSTDSNRRRSTDSNRRRSTDSNRRRSTDSQSRKRSENSTNFDQIKQNSKKPKESDTHKKERKGSSKEAKDSKAKDKPKKDSSRQQRKDYDQTKSSKKPQRDSNKRMKPSGKPETTVSNDDVGETQTAGASDVLWTIEEVNTSHSHK